MLINIGNGSNKIITSWRIETPVAQFAVSPLLSQTALMLLSKEAPTEHNQLLKPLGIQKWTYELAYTGKLLWFRKKSRKR